MVWVRYSAKEQAHVSRVAVFQCGELYPIRLKSISFTSLVPAAIMHAFSVCLWSNPAEYIYRETNHKFQKPPTK